MHRSTMPQHSIGFANGIITAERREAEGGEEVVSLKGRWRLTRKRARHRWRLALFMWAFSTACFTLSAWTGYNKFRPEGVDPLPFEESVVSGISWGFVVFLCFTFWPWRDPT